MANRDGKGPRGKGPNTGRGAGPCKTGSPKGAPRDGRGTGRGNRRGGGRK